MNPPAPRPYNEGMRPSSIKAAIVACVTLCCSSLACLCSRQWSTIVFTCMLLVTVAYVFYNDVLDEKLDGKPKGTDTYLP